MDAERRSCGGCRNSYEEPAPKGNIFLRCGIARAVDGRNIYAVVDYYPEGCSGGAQNDWPGRATHCEHYIRRK